MHLVRADAVAALVEEIDHVIDATSPQPATPILRGEVDEFEDWVGDGATLIRHTTPGGERTVRNIPTRLLTPKVRRAFYRLFVAIEAAEETTPIGGPVRA